MTIIALALCLILLLAVDLRVLRAIWRYMNNPRATGPAVDRKDSQ
jgi:hypothetical protein